MQRDRAETVELGRRLQIEEGRKRDDRRIPPANRLEKLKGDLAGRYSVRINDQFRLVFRFDGGQAHDVTIVDYH